MMNDPKLNGDPETPNTPETPGKPDIPDMPGVEIPQINEPKIPGQNPVRA